MCSYNRRHIRSFAEIAKPLYDLTKKGKRFEWAEQQQDAFEQLKRCLVSEPLLASPIDGGLYWLDTDASSHSLSAILQSLRMGLSK